MNHDSILITAGIIAGTFCSILFYFKGWHAALRGLDRDTDELRTAAKELKNENAALAKQLNKLEEKLAGELKDWRELFEAFAVLPLPEEHRQRKLWPNKWHKDCAVVALALHNMDRCAK